MIATSPLQWHSGVSHVGACEGSKKKWTPKRKQEKLCCYDSLIDFVVHFLSLNLLLPWTTSNHHHHHHQAALQWVAQVEYALGFSLIAIALFSGRNGAGRVGFRWCNPKDQWIRFTPKKEVMNCIKGIHRIFVKNWFKFFFPSKWIEIVIKLPSRGMYFNLCGNWQWVAC